MARSRAPRRRRRFGSFSSWTPGAGARRGRSPHTHAPTRAHTSGLSRSRPCPPRARPGREDGGAREERKGRGRVTGGGGSCGGRGGARSGESRRRRRRPPGPAAASASPLLGTGTDGAERAGGLAAGLRSESRSGRGLAGTVQPVRGGCSRGRSRGRNEPRAGGRARRAPRAGEGARAGGAGAAGKTRSWSRRGLRLAARRALGSGNEKAAAGGFPFRVCQTKGTSPGWFGGIPLAPPHLPPRSLSSPTPSPSPVPSLLFRLHFTPGE